MSREQGKGSENRWIDEKVDVDIGGMGHVSVDTGQAGGQCIRLSCRPSADGKWSGSQELAYLIRWHGRR